MLQRHCSYKFWHLSSRGDTYAHSARLHMLSGVSVSQTLTYPLLLLCLPHNTAQVQHRLSVRHPAARFGALGEGAHAKARRVFLVLERPPAAALGPWRGKTLDDAQQPITFCLRRR